MRRVHVPELPEGGGEVPLAGRDAEHLARVLRVAPGQPVRAFDGRGREAEGEVLEVDPAGGGGPRVRLRLDAPGASDVEPDLEATVAVALLKGDKLAEVVRRGTELGAARFALVHARRADVPHVKPAKLERLRRVAVEAAKQSGRARVPEVLEPVPLAGFAPDGPLLVADPYAPADLASTLAGLRAAGPAGEGGRERVSILTGPEGGFAPEEVEALAAAGARRVRLGARILRAETAPVALLAALLVPEAR